MLPVSKKDNQENDLSFAKTLSALTDSNDNSNS